MWSWWTSCWSVGKTSGCGSASGCADSVSSTGGGCAAALKVHALSANRTTWRLPTSHHHGLSQLKDPCCSPPDPPRTETHSVRSTTRPNLVHLCLGNPMWPLHKQTGGAERVHKDDALITIIFAEWVSVVVVVLCCIAGKSNATYLI